jgi:hypothetical protein
MSMTAFITTLGITAIVMFLASIILASIILADLALRALWRWSDPARIQPMDTPRDRTLWQRTCPPWLHRRQ